MALRIGKKNNADDWSDEALKQELAQISGQSAVDATPPSSTGDDDPLADLLADMPAASSPPVPVPDVPFDTHSAAAPPPVARKTPRVSPILLAAGLVFLVVAVGAGLWLALSGQPSEDETPPALPPRITRADPPEPARPLPATKTLPSKGAPVPAAKVVAPRTPVKMVTPGKAGIASKNATAPGVAPPKPGQAPRLVPVKGVPTPVLPAPGMAGQPGKGSTRTTTVQIVRPVTALTPALAQQLKALWKQSADAKHRGDNAGARRAWTQMLQLRPGHPGVQDAINKLPQ